MEELLDTFTPLLTGHSLGLLDLQGQVLTSRGEKTRIIHPLETQQLAALVSLSPKQECYSIERLDWLPLWIQEELVGFLVCTGGITPAVLALTKSLVLQLEAGIEKRHLARETLDRYREVNLLYQLAENISQTLDVNEILRLVLTETYRVIPGRCACLLLGRQINHGTREPASLGDPSAIQPVAGFFREWLQTSQQAPSPRIVAEIPGWRGEILFTSLMADGNAFGLIAVARAPGGEGFYSGDEKLLSAVSSQAGFAVEKSLLHQNELQRLKVEQELQIGERIQRSLLPRTLPHVPGWDFAASYQSASQVGGDFYDIYPLSGATDLDFCWGITIADVTGKGIPAALMMAFSQAILQVASAVQKGPAETLAQANQVILQRSHSELLLTAFYAWLRSATGELVYANAGHEPPLWYQSASDSCGELECGSSLLIGARRNTQFVEGRIVLAPGDVLVFYTDGVTEARSPEGAFFDVLQLQRIIHENAAQGAAGILQAIVSSVRDFSGDAPQADDITVFILKRLL